MKAFFATNIIVFLLALIIFGLKLKQPQINLPPVSIGDSQSIQQNFRQLDEINAPNKNINSFTCDNLILRIWQNNLRFKLNGMLYYEKPRNFRMVVKSIAGTESDVGSNNQLFWFWSKRMKPKALYYANHEDLSRTRLKSPFTPLWLMESLCINEIKQSATMTETTKYFVFIEVVNNPSNKKVQKFTYVNKSTKHIDGFIVKDMNGNTQCSSEVVEWYGNLPQQILYNWHEENITMIMEFNNPSSNQKVEQTIFRMPPIQPQINMSKD
jgi:hypothetical protein